MEDNTEDLFHKLKNPKRRMDMDNKFALHYIGHKRWDFISKNISPDDYQIWLNLYEIGKNPNPAGHRSNDRSNRSIMYCGEDLYLKIRPKLINHKLILGQPITISQNPLTKEKYVNKGKKIIYENTLKKLEIELNFLLQRISSEDNNNSWSFKIMELTLVKLMSKCNTICSKIKMLKQTIINETLSRHTNQNEIIDLDEKLSLCRREVVELIVGYNKIIIEKKMNTQISQTCVSDLVAWVDYAKKEVEFNPIDVIIKNPELIFRTIYDGILENRSMGLYQSQKEIFEFVTSVPSYLALVHTMLGSGKTSMILPLCGWLMINRKINKSKILFCCPNEIVILEVARMIYGMGVPFGIVISKKENELIYKWSSFVDKNNPKDSSILYLCDVFVARQLLEERSKCLKSKELYLNANKKDAHNFPLTENRIPYVPDYIFIGDELTKDADSQVGFQVDSGFSVTTELFIELMKISSPKIILMSATLPTFEQLPKLYQAIVDVNPGMIVKSFTSMESNIGCSLISSSGDIYAPHIGCVSINDIKNILLTIKTNPFIGRFYTIEVLLDMINRFKEFSLPTPDLIELFNDPSQATQTNIQKIAYEMLANLLHDSSKYIIKLVCMAKKSNEKYINLNNIFTTDIHRFNKGCLIFSSDPVSLAIKLYQSNFDKFLNDTTERNIFEQVRIDIILEKYDKKIDVFEKSIKRIKDKKDPGAIKQNKNNNKKENLVQNTAKIISDMNDKKPTWDFPEELQLCSPKHLSKMKYETTFASETICPENLPKNTNVSMDILTMLASGIAIYTTTSSALDDDYLNTVLMLAKKGLIKMLFTDNSIAYGTNLSVSNIIIIDDVIDNMPSIIDNHSMKTIFQMLGRAGRGGNLSYKANIYTVSTDDKLINMINSYIKQTLDEGNRNEIKNISRAFDAMWNNKKN